MEVEDVVEVVGAVGVVGAVEEGVEAGMDNPATPAITTSTTTTTIGGGQTAHLMTRVIRNMTPEHSPLVPSTSVLGEPIQNQSFAERLLKTERVLVVTIVDTSM